MSNMLKTIVPKSDQLNADDLIGKTITIEITGLSIAMGDQPVCLSYRGDNGKPYKPGKSMRRVLVNAWGSDGNVYVGRWLTLYRDEKVMFGGLAVGGIRISHMSHISAPITMALTASKANKKPFTVKPLIVDAPAAKTETLTGSTLPPLPSSNNYYVCVPAVGAGENGLIDYTSEIVRMIKNCKSFDEFNLIRTTNKDGLAELATRDEKLRAQITEISQTKAAALKAPPSPPAQE